MSRDRVDVLIKFHNLWEYQSRQFCKEECYIQDLIDNDGNTEEVKKMLKDRNCRDGCRAYEFHQWLKENGYKIVKG